MRVSDSHRLIGLTLRTVIWQNQDPSDNTTGHDSEFLFYPHKSSSPIESNSVVLAEKIDLVFCCCFLSLIRVLIGGESNGPSLTFYAIEVKTAMSFVCASGRLCIFTTRTVMNTKRTEFRRFLN